MPAAPQPQDEVIAFLSGGRAFGKLPDRVDTHAASVFLVGDRAWKLKRAIRFDYLDFSTPARRRSALEAELRLNRRTAPTLYLAVHCVTRDSQGHLAIDGEGEPIDWLLEMRRFADEDLFEHMAAAGRLDTSVLMRLTERLVAFHQCAGEAIQTAGAASFRRIVEGTKASMAAFPETIDRDQAGRVTGRLLVVLDEVAPLLDGRALGGRVRHGHGDLHLGNIALVDGEPTMFDCLEFSTELAMVDVLYDLAFLLLDLWQRGLKTEANAVFNRYLDLSPLDEAGIALMPLFLSTRAAIRAHVIAAENERTRDPAAHAEATRFLDLALNLLTPPPARVVAIGGLSGTGKSTLARHLGGEVGTAPGARVIRSDVLRKRLAGAGPEVRLSAEYYSAAANSQVYTRLYVAAAAALGAGRAVIADAVFAKPYERTAIAAVAHDACVDFTGIWLEAQLPQRLEHLSARTGDASDADAAVAHRQEQVNVGSLGTWYRLAATGSPGVIADAAHALLASPPT